MPIDYGLLRTEPVNLLANYQQGVNFANQNLQNTMQQQEMMRNLQRRNQLAQIMQQSGGDFNKMVPALAQGGFMQEAAQANALRRPYEQAFNLRPGEKRFSPTGQLIAEVPEQQQWSNPYQMGGATVQRNLVTGEIRTAVGRAPVTNISMGKPPSGYRYTKEGDLQPIPGGPADVKVQQAQDKDTAVLASSVDSMDRLAVAANEVMNHPGLAGTTGIRGMIPAIPGSEAANANALMDTLKSQVAFSVLQEMRNNSKTGGALGQVSDKEQEMLKSNLAALQKSQSVDQLRANLQKIIDYTEQAKGRFENAYRLKYEKEEQKPSPKPKGKGKQYPLRNAKGWTLHTDAQGNQAYVSPDGTQFEEVQ